MLQLLDNRVKVSQTANAGQRRSLRRAGTTAKRSQQQGSLQEAERDALLVEATGPNLIQRGGAGGRVRQAKIGFQNGEDVEFRAVFGGSEAHKNWVRGDSLAAGSGNSAKRRCGAEGDLEENGHGHRMNRKQRKWKMDQSPKCWRGPELVWEPGLRGEHSAFAGRHADSGGAVRGLQDCFDSGRWRPDDSDGGLWRCTPANNSAGRGSNWSKDRIPCYNHSVDNRTAQDERSEKQRTRLAWVGLGDWTTAAVPVSLEKG